MGQSYDPTAALSCENTRVLMHHIWSSRHQEIQSVIRSTKALPSYRALIENTFSKEAQNIADREIFNMVTDAKSFNDPEYRVFPDDSDKSVTPKMLVGYKRLDRLTTSVHYGALT